MKAPNTHAAIPFHHFNCISTDTCILTGTISDPIKETIFNLIPGHKLIMLSENESKPGIMVPAQRIGSS